MLDWIFEWLKLREKRKVLRKDIRTYQKEVKEALSMYEYKRAALFQEVVDTKTKELLDTYNM